MDRSERIALILAGSLMVVFLAALIYAARGLGMAVPSCVTDVAPFSTGRIIDKGNKHYEVHVVAKMWVFDPPEVRLPAGAEVDLYVSAADVTHGFYIVGTDLNLMAVPGAVNYAHMRFDREGEHQILCHEYCGVGHQAMAGKFVIGPLPAAAAVASGGSAGAGKQLFQAKGCAACHTVDGSAGGDCPTLKGILGRSEETANGKTVLVDEAFIAGYMRQPNHPQLKGFQPIMPRIPLTDSEVQQLTDYLKTL